MASNNCTNMGRLIKIFSSKQYTLIFEQLFKAILTDLLIQWAMQAEKLYAKSELSSLGKGEDNYFSIEFLDCMLQVLLNTYWFLKVRSEKT